MADQVHAVMESVKATSPNAAIDRVVAETQAQQLEPGHDPVLQRRQVSDRAVDFRMLAS
jgi:hypothetical protein